MALPLEDPHTPPPMLPLNQGACILESNPVSSLGSSLFTFRQPAQSSWALLFVLTDTTERGMLSPFAADGWITVVITV